MIAFTDFLANNYLWFLVISLILIFSLIGYFVDQSELKKGVSMFAKGAEEEKDIHELAASAGNKSLNSAVSDAVKNTNAPETPNPIPEVTPQVAPQAVPQNTIVDTTVATSPNNENQNNNPIGFDVLTK